MTLAADAARRASTKQVTVTGEAAHEWRTHYQSPAERPERYGKAWAQKHPGAHRRVGRDARLDDLERPVEVRAAVDVPDWARPEAGGELVMPALGREADMLRSYARLSARKHDLVLGYPVAAGGSGDAWRCRRASRWSGCRRRAPSRRRSGASR